MIDLDAASSISFLTACMYLWTSTNSLSIVSLSLAISNSKLTCLALTFLFSDSVYFWWLNILSSMLSILFLHFTYCYHYLMYTAITDFTEPMLVCNLFQHLVYLIPYLYASSMKLFFTQLALHPLIFLSYYSVANFTFTPFFHGTPAVRH